MQEVIKKGIAILGSTGSIGTQTLDIIKANPSIYQVYALVCGENFELLTKQIREFEPKVVCVKDEVVRKNLLENLASNNLKAPEILIGEAGTLAIINNSSVEVVVNALVGFAGLAPCLEAIRNNKDLAVANKECFVAAGGIIRQELTTSRSRLIPLDSEHSSLFQTLLGHVDLSHLNVVGNNFNRQIETLIVTASGGPFWKLPLEDFAKITKEQALKHPKWSMGAKITIDSAGLMNKGLEVIEAMWLFNEPLEKVQVLVHPECLVHGLVEFADRGLIAGMYEPDMHTPIAFALCFLQNTSFTKTSEITRDNLKGNVTPLNLPGTLSSHYPSSKIGSSSNPFSYGNKFDYKKLASLSFFEPDLKKFKSLALCYHAQKLGGLYPTVLNAANEVAVDAFLKDKISFIEIPQIVEKALDNFGESLDYTVENILYLNSKVKKSLEEFFLI